MPRGAHPLLAEACWVSVDLEGFRAAQVVRDLGTADVDARLEELLIDGILYAFQEQVPALCVPGSRGVP